MALFSRKTSKKEVESKKTVKAAPSAAKSDSTNEANTGTSDKQLVNRSVKPVLKGMRITEKAVLGHDDGTYVFDVSVDATKAEIKKAVKRIYDVNPISVNVVNHPGKIKRRGNKVGRTAKSRKAYVTLPAGKSIEIA